MTSELAISDEARDLLPTETLVRVSEGHARGEARCAICDGAIVPRAPASVLVAIAPGETLVRLAHADCSGSRVVASAQAPELPTGGFELSWRAAWRQQRPRAALILEVQLQSLTDAGGCVRDMQLELRRAAGAAPATSPALETSAPRLSIHRLVIGSRSMELTHGEFAVRVGSGEIAIPAGAGETFDSLPEAPWVEAALAEAEALLIFGNGRLAVADASVEELEDRLEEAVALGELLAGVVAVERV